VLLVRGGHEFPVPADRAPQFTCFTSAKVQILTPSTKVPPPCEIARRRVCAIPCRVAMPDGSRFFTLSGLFIIHLSACRKRLSG
jgi:hypothetical protein